MTDMQNRSLNAYLAQQAPMPEVGQVLVALAKAAGKIARLSARVGLGDAHNHNLADVVGTQNADGDLQKGLDVHSDALIQEALMAAGVGVYFSEEQEAPVTLHEGAPLGVACDPLDGSSNIDTNLTIGTIISVFAMADCRDGLPPKGRKQLAAAMFIYGPQTSLLLSFGDEVAAFGLMSTDAGEADIGEAGFMRADWQVSIAPTSDEFAINSANAAFWPIPIAAYIDELVVGARRHHSGMRWCGSLVADGCRIFRRGGIFLYPQDSRAGYEAGRLRLIYEANPLAFLVEAAGGSASTGLMDILDVIPEKLHQRVPLIFGSADEVAKVTALYRAHNNDKEMPL